MICKYKGYELRVTKEGVYDGVVLSYSIVRLSDQRICTEGTDDTGAMRKLLANLKDEVDEELATSDPWDLKAEDEEEARYQERQKAQAEMGQRYTQFLDLLDDSSDGGVVEMMKACAMELGDRLRRK